MTDELSRFVPPWETSMYKRIRELEAENAELKVQNSQLHSQLVKARQWAKTQTENWKLRQQAWRKERAELESLSLSKGKSPSPDGEVRL